MDTIVEFVDKTFGVVDFKTVESKPENVSKYSRQLHSYATDLERPAPKKPGLSPVSKLGLICAEPTHIVAIDGGYAYHGKAVWQECPRDDTKFLDFLGEVVEIMESQSLPPAGKDCSWCQYRETARVKGY